MAPRRICDKGNGPPQRKRSQTKENIRFEPPGKLRAGTQYSLDIQSYSLSFFCVLGMVFLGSKYRTSGGGPGYLGNVGLVQMIFLCARVIFKFQP